ncbi:hypothetical protein BKG76_09665 [Mycobacteroides franklinii]|uniref:HEPN domain-containing protein n=1 Tax=Mycobacteroides franklinii TaxID=948102 RepID=A0A1S1L2A0_9MYCO|nr:hypothetical protein [Mycobacteroides franklinii]OHU20984.1 hypothetical protein BKG76_09665 [Mycobacteroides franklinii]
MTDARNPWDIPEWRALGREAALVRQLIGSGATALGHANYADLTGVYYTAFFGLSIGLERLCKLILVADHAINHQGELPTQKFVKSYGHKLTILCDKVEEIANNHQLEIRYSRPKNEITSSILNCLDAFADAGRGRYANFAELGDPNLSQDEPIANWWNDVAEAILTKHYYGKRAQQGVESRAALAHALLAPYSSVLFVNETNDVMTTPLDASIRTGQAELVQRYGRYYALTIARWLADVFCELTRKAWHKQNIHAFFGVWEHLWDYAVSDDFLKTRKVWPLK